MAHSRMVSLTAVVGGLLLPGLARAQCCQGYSLATACAPASLTKSRWCIQDSVPNGQSALAPEFCAYGDAVVATLEKLFDLPAQSTFEFELDAQTGGAHTGTPCGHLGDGVAYDAFSGNAYGAKGFWGYLLSLHEAVNDWTGQVSSGWPTDFWADHQSAFPNLMDFHVMNTIGMANGDQNLIKAAAAQKKRFYPNGDQADPKVVALDNVFASMPNGDGYAGFRDMFALVIGDGMKWDRLGVGNPDVKRTEYVAAYMSLAARQNVLRLLQGPGANGGGNICNGTPDGTSGDKPYTCDSGHIDAIATAHCSIAANGKPQADLTTYRAGSYANVPSGPCGAKCPIECACDAANHCVPSWLGASKDAGSEGGVSAMGGAAGAPSMSGGSAGKGNGGTASAAGGGGGAAASTGGRSTGGADTSSGGNGPLGDGGASGSSSPTSGAAPDAGRSMNGTHSESSSCGCRVGASESSRTTLASMGALLFALLLANRRPFRS